MNKLREYIGDDAVGKTTQSLYRSMEVVKPANNYLIDHTASYLLLNPSLELIGLLTNPHKASKMAPALALIIKTLD